MSDRINHIVVIRLSAMGDVAISVPVLKSLIAQFPELKITVLTKAFHAPIFKDLKNVEVLKVDTKGTHKGIFGLWRLSRTIRDLNPDAIADLHGVLRTHILKIFLPGIPFKQIDKGRVEKKKLVNGKLFEQLKPTYQRYISVFNELGIELEPNFSLLKAQPIPANFEHQFNRQKKVIGIAPLAAFDGKTYPLDLMKKVVEELNKEYQVLLFGGPQDIDTLNELLCGDVLNLAGQADLESELNIISNLDLMISMDSGNAHLAAMYAVPTITLWGVTHPYAGFSPIGQAEENVLLADRSQFPDIPTSIYGNKLPEGYEKAMRTISVEKVVELARRLLQN